MAQKVDARKRVKEVEKLEAPASGNKIHYILGVRGLGVRVTAAGAKAFVLNYRTRGGRERRFTIGTFLRENEALAIHRDTALAFADRRRIKPPSWWKATPGRKVEHKAFPQGEAEEWFAIRIGGWSGEAPPPSESDDRAAFEVHLGRRVSREEFREVRRRLVPSNWLQPGRRPNSRMKFAAN
jgi:hypothetical protein